MQYTILIVDDESEICLSLSEILESRGYRTLYCQNPLNVTDIINNNEIQLIILDIKMPAMSGIDLLKVIKKSMNTIPIIVISGHATVDTIVTSMKYGALNFYTKPIENKKLLEEIKKLSDSKIGMQKETVDNQIISRNHEMKKIIKFIGKAAPTNAAVLITGESGTGKELVADALHYLSPRSNKPYIKINCAAIPEALLESEMFGHEKGAFTDARNLKHGKFELANEGTIFLDEIGDMSIKTQAKMLRVLQEKKFSRVGGSKELKTNCRVIAATNKDLSQLILKGLFREDLYYRLSVITINLPPIRKRKEDIMLIANHFLSDFSYMYNKKIDKISEDVKTLLLQHNWPGNVRELKNFIERAVIFCDTDTIEVACIPEQYNTLALNQNHETYNKRYNNQARDIIIEALEKSKYVKKRAAELLNIDRKTLYNKMKKYNIE